ncbi:MAG: chitobiase/beta-hexosaminidase C-terminal domain-containing protein, partial [Candidatus Limivicinus sp.]
MNKRGLSRMLSVLLLLVMVVSMLPVSAYAEGTTATLVTDISSLSVGDKVVVVAKDYDFALGTNQKTNNREAVAITKTDGNVTLTDTVQVLTLEAGTKEGTFALNTGSGYLYAASSDKNYLRTEATLSDNSSWTVEIASDGTATIKAQGTNTRNWLRYNPNNGTPIFSCYAKGQNDICIYKVGSGVVDPDPEPIETVATPTASPAAGEVEKGTQVSFACATEGATVYYKTTGEYAVFTDPIAVNEDTTFTVKATKDGMNDSAEATFAYTVKTESTEKPWKDVAAKYSIYELVDAPQAGDVVLLYNPGNGQALSSTASGYYLAGDAQTPTDNYIKIDVADTEAVEWTVGSGTESSVTFTQGDKKLSALASGDYFNLSTDPENKTEWLLGDCNAETSTHYVYSRELTGGYGNVYIEWYAKNGAFSAYCTSTDRLNEKDFGFAFYKLVREGVKTEEPPAPEYDTIAEALAGAEGTSFTVKGVVTLVDGKNIFIQDETGGICAYMATKPTDISLGDTIIATGSRAAYKGLPQLSGATYEKSSGLTLKAKPTTIGALTNADVCTYVQLTGLEITEVYDKDGTYSTPNITVKDAEGNTIQLYKAVINKADSAWEYAVGDKIDVTAAVGVNNTTLQLRNTLPGEITLPPKTQYAKLTDTIADGDQFVIYYNKDSSVMTETVSGKGLAGVAATPTGDFLEVAEEMAVLTAAKDADGNYTFTTADGKYLTSGATGNSLTLADAASDYSLWTLKPVTGGFHIVNVNAVYNGSAQAMEIYNSVFTTFSEKDTDYYLFNLYKLTDEEPPAVSDGVLEDGAQVVIYNASAEGVIGLEDELGASMSCVPATIEDGKAIVGNGGRVFTVSVSGEDYSFESGGKYLAANDAEELFLAETLDDYAKWNLEKKSVGYVMNNKAAKYTFSGGSSATVCIEYFSGSFSGWTYKSADSAIFEMNFYPVADDTPVTQGIVNKPAIVFGALPEAYVGQDYTFTFTVDAVFGVDGTPSAQVMLNTPQEIMVNQDGETYRITVPARFLEGLESLTVHVTALDTLGTPIEGDAVFTVLDEPVFSDLTPNPGSQTGEEKRPLISAKVANAGENPTITMTVNGEDVIPSYNEGLISYMAESEMEEGRTTVTITVTRADGKEATKSWSFTVGTATYQLYFGQLHSHTTYSDGSGSLETALDYVKNLPDSANVDFVAFTDHSNYFDSTSAANPEEALYDMSLASETSQNLWNTYKSTVAAF